MHKFILETPIKDCPEDQIMTRFKETIMANTDLKIAMMVGCQIETFVTDHADGSKTFTVKTVNPVSILKTPDGKIISVVELVGGKIIIK